jgi:hypothetical protein
MKLPLKAVRLSGLLFAIILSALFHTERLAGQGNAVASVYERLLRVEINAKSDDETYRLIPCGEKGVILFYKSLEIVEQDKVKWYFSFYDKDLQLLWTKSIGLANALEFKKYSFDPDILSLFFRADEKAKESEFNFQIIRLVLENGMFMGNRGKFPENAVVVDFIASKSKAYVGFNVKNEPARIMIMNLQNGNQLISPLRNGTVSTLMQLYLDSAGSKLISSTRKMLVRNQPEFVLSVFDSSGNLLNETTISSITPEHELNDMRFMLVNPGEIFVVGTYGSPPVQKSSSRNLMPGESTGFFFTRVYDNQLQSIIYYNFLELKNANMLLGEKDIEAIKKKSMKKNKSLNEYSIDLTLLLHPLTIKNNEIILMAESFFPQYHSENFTDYDFYGRPFTNTYSVFDGYRYSKGIIAGFDKTGKLLWDNSTDIRNLLSFELNSKVVRYDQGNNNVMAYLSEGKIASKIIHNNEVVEKLDFSPIEMEYPNDKLLSETKSRIVHWYGNFFLCYGYQEIKNVSLERNNKRLVFYFNKVRFD